MSTPFATFSASIARLVTATAPLLSAIRTGPNRHVTGLLIWNDTIVTTDQALPVLDLYSVVLPTGGLLAARPGPRDQGNDVASLRLDKPVTCHPLMPGAAVLGSLLVVLAADQEAAPTVRLTTVHRMLRHPAGLLPVADLAPHQIDPGAVALDADGRFVGLIAEGPGGEALVVPAAAVRQSFQGSSSSSIPRASQARPEQAVEPAVEPPWEAQRESASRATPGWAGQRGADGGGRGSSARGWLGLALQPITIPDALVARTGQKSARMVVSLTTGGPAERAGLRIGDILLTVNGTSTSGNHVLRGFLLPEKIGSVLEVRLLRDGNRLSARLVVAPQPDI